MPDFLNKEADRIISNLKTKQSAPSQDAELIARLREIVTEWAPGKLSAVDAMHAIWELVGDNIPREPRAALEQTDAKGTGDTPSRDVYGSD